ACRKVCREAAAGKIGRVQMDAMMMINRKIEQEGVTKMIRIGIVGIGFMGMIHYLASRKLKDAQVTAICSRDEKKLAGDWRSIQGNFGPRGEKMDLAGIKKYRKLEDMLADKDIDMIDVCNPTHLHPETAIKAL